MHRKLAAALVAALALGVASCGGSDSAEPLTRAQLVRGLETACRAAQARAEQVGRRDGANIFAAALAGQEQLLERVQALEPPEALQGDLDTLERSLAERVDVVSKVAAADRADVARAFEAEGRRMAEVTRSLEGVYRRLGVEGCS